MIEEHKILRAKALSETRELRKSQGCKVFEVKISQRKLSVEKKDYLNRLFLESKWFYNSIIASDNVLKFDSKVKVVTVLNKDKQPEERELKTLSAQMKQAIKDRTLGSIKSLSSKKKKGKESEIGRLTFKSVSTSIPLKQFGATYRVENNKYIAIQGFKKHFKVSGLNQIKGDIANANLIRKPSGFYLKITCFVAKETKTAESQIGLDFGIKDTVVNSNGEKFNFQFPESKRTIEISRKFNRAKIGSNNRYKLKSKLQLSYELNTNKKNDAKNKFVSKLLKENDLIAIQDESVHEWHKSKQIGFGKKIQHSITGGIIAKLKNSSATTVIDKYFPSTQLCPKCSALNKHSLSERVYNCYCGYSKDRDTHAACNILSEALRLVRSVSLLSEINSV